MIASNVKLLRKLLAIHVPQLSAAYAWVSSPYFFNELAYKGLGGKFRQGT